YCDTRSHICELRFYGGPRGAPQTWGSAPPSTKTAGSVVREELGFRSVNGLDLVGTREIQPLGRTATGSDPPLAVGKECWYSRQLVNHHPQARRSAKWHRSIHGHRHPTVRAGS